MGLVLPEVYGERPGEGRASSHAGLTPEGGRERAVGGGPQTPMPFPERPSSCCALIPEALWPCLPAVGPEQTGSLSDPSFHHFTRKDLKVRRCCRPAWLRPEGSGSFQQSGKRSEPAAHLVLANILIPDTQPVSPTRPHWTDRKTEADRQDQVSQ